MQAFSGEGKRVENGETKSTMCFNNKTADTTSQKLNTNDGLYRWARERQQKLGGKKLQDRRCLHVGKSSGRTITTPDKRKEKSEESRPFCVLLGRCTNARPQTGTGVLYA